MTTWACLLTHLLWISVFKLFHYFGCKNAYYKAEKSARVADRVQVVKGFSMALLEAFLFSYRNPQSDSHIKRVVNAWNNNLTFLRVIQILLVLQ